MRGVRRGRPSLRAPGVGPRRGPRLPRGGRTALQGGDPRRPADRGRRAGRGTAAGLDLSARALHRPLPRPARRVHRPHRPLQAALRGRRLLARPRGPAHAAAHLRHRVVDPGGAGPLPVAPRGGPQARPSPPRRGPRPLQLPRRQPGLGLLAPQGPDALADPGDGHARAAGAARLPGGRARPSSCTRSSGSSRATGTTTREQHVPRRVRGAGLPPQAHELPGVDVHLPQPRALLPRAAAAPVRVRAAASQRALRRALRPDPRAPLRPGRRPHLRASGPAGRRDRGPPRRGARGLRLVRPRARFAFATRPEKALGDPAAWERAEGAHARGARRQRACATRVKPRGRHLLRAQDRHLRRGRPGSRVADGHHPGGPR